MKQSCFYFNPHFLDTAVSLKTHFVCLAPVEHLSLLLSGLFLRQGKFSPFYSNGQQQYEVYSIDTYSDQEREH